MKAIKCYQKLLCYLSFYINLLNIRLSAWVSGKYYWQYNHLRICPNCIADHIALIALNVMLIVLLWPYRLIALLWLYCSGRIVDFIALIVSLWPYCWLHCFDRVVLAVLLIVLFGQLFALSHLKVQVVQNIIYRPDKSRTYIWLSSKTYFRTLNRWII